MIKKMLFLFLFASVASIEQNTVCMKAHSCRKKTRKKKLFIKKESLGKKIQYEIARRKLILGEIEEVKRLQKKHNLDSNYQYENFNKMTLFNFAIEHAGIKAIKFLSKNGKPIQNPELSLELAIRNGKVDIVRYLVLNFLDKEAIANILEKKLEARALGLPIAIIPDEKLEKKINIIIQYLQTVLNFLNSENKADLIAQALTQKNNTTLYIKLALKEDISRIKKNKTIQLTELFMYNIYTASLKHNVCKNKKEFLEYIFTQVRKHEKWFNNSKNIYNRLERLVQDNIYIVDDAQERKEFLLKKITPFFTIQVKNQTLAIDKMFLL